MIYIKQSISKELRISVLARHLPSLQQFILQRKFGVDTMLILIPLGVVTNDVVWFLLLLENIILILSWHWSDYSSAIVRYLS